MENEDPTGCVPEVPGPADIVDVRSQPRSPRTPFNPRSPEGRKHPSVTSDTGSQYKCRENLGVDPSTHVYRQLHVAQAEMIACGEALSVRRARRARSEYDARSNRAFARGALQGCALYDRVLEAARAHNQRSYEESERAIARAYEGGAFKRKRARMRARALECFERNKDRLARHAAFRARICGELEAFRAAAEPANGEAEGLAGAVRRLRF